ncbi:hypothetical protein [Rhodopseudomonas palustris]|uniref:Uncharacterized protein n=1 Tax=Rhodopseudomonas palustris (strain BisB18) TaxID=316056 RepID=Q20ZI8_RHOPB
MSAALYGVDRRYNVADIELDLFLDQFSNVDCGRQRQPSILQALSCERLRAFLEGQCGLEPGDNRVPGRFIVHHDEAFGIIRQLIGRHGPMSMLI